MKQTKAALMLFVVLTIVAAIRFRTEPGLATSSGQMNAPGTA